MCACGDWQGFVSMLRQLLDEETGREYGGNGRQYVEQKHDITKIIEEYKKIFRRLVPDYG